MHIIALHNRSYDRERGAFVEVIDALLRVDADGLTVLDGDPEWRHLAETVLDHPDDPTRDLELSDDPALWAATLPQAFRSGDTIVVVHDHDAVIAVGDVVAVTAQAQAV